MASVSQREWRSIVKETADWKHVVTLYEQTRWEVTLLSGHTIVIWASGFSIDSDTMDYVFDILIDGIPREMLDVARIPSELVANVESAYVGKSEPDDAK